MKVLFIGGTGRLSKDVAQLALMQNNDVYLLTRGSDNRRVFVDERYNMLYGDIRDKNKCTSLLEGMYFDVIIDFLTYNEDHLKNVLDIIEGKYGQYIFISTATVYMRENYDELISEDRTPIGNSQWKYAYDKYLCEKYLQEYFANSQAHYTIVRPYVTYGNTRIPYPIVPLNPMNEWSFINRIKKGKLIPVFDNGDTITTITHTQDFARATVGLFQNSNALNEAFHITNSNSTTWGEVLEVLEKVTSLKIERICVKQTELYSVLHEYEDILKGDKGCDTRFDNSKIRGVVPAFECVISLEQGLSEMVEFYERHPELQLIDYLWEGRMDRFCYKGKALKSVRPQNLTFKQRYHYYCGIYPMLEKMDRLIRKIVG